MHTPTIMVVLGNRPQFIKHAAFQRAWDARAPHVRLEVVDTGQHYNYELAGIFLDELKIASPSHSLGVGSASHAEQLARMLVPLEELMRASRPTSVVVYGDTNSTLGGALAAAKLNIPVAHVEAGLRSYDMRMPEELNRVLVDHASSLLYCPTEAAVANLTREGIAGEHVHLVGDVMADIALAVAPLADDQWKRLSTQLDLPAREAFALCTIHRAANTEPDALREIIACLEAVDMPVVMPVHPRTEALAVAAGVHVDLASIPNVRLLPPLGYVDLAACVRAAACVLTDSGGLQKEAYIHGTPCITMRDTTEWTETVDTGLNILVGRDPAALNAAIDRATGSEIAGLIDERPQLYGDGTSAEQIVDSLLEHAEHASHFAL